MRTDIAALIDELFPYMPKPHADEISAHREGCADCEMARNHLVDLPEAPLSAEAIRFLHTELSVLSPRAMAWVLPSYLRYVIRQEDDYDSPTQFLIFHLSPKQEFEEATKARLAELTVKQIACLVSVLDFLQDRTWWAEWHSEDLLKAKNFLQGLRERDA